MCDSIVMGILPDFFRNIWSWGVISLWNFIRRPMITLFSNILTGIVHQEKTIFGYVVTCKYGNPCQWALASSSNDPSFSHKNGDEVLCLKLIESMYNLTIKKQKNGKSMYYQCKENRNDYYYYFFCCLLVIKYYTVCMLMISPYIWWQFFSWDEGACYAPKEIWNSMMLVHWGNTNSKYNHSTTSYWADNWDDIPSNRRGSHPCFDPDKDLVLPAWKRPDIIALSSKLWARYTFH